MVSIVTEKNKAVMSTLAWAADCIPRRWLVDHSVTGQVKNTGKTQLAICFEIFFCNKNAEGMKGVHG